MTTSTNNSTVTSTSTSTAQRFTDYLQAEIDASDTTGFEFEHFMKNFDRFNPESKSMYTKDSSGRITLTPLGKGICLNDAKSIYARYTYFALKDVFDPVVLSRYTSGDITKVGWAIFRDALRVHQDSRRSIGLRSKKAVSDLVNAQRALGQKKRAIKINTLKTRLGEDGFNTMMQRDKARMHNKSTELTGSKKDKQFAEWRQSPQGRLYDLPMSKKTDGFTVLSLNYNTRFGRTIVEFSTSASIGSVIEKLIKNRPRDTFVINYNVDSLTGDVPYTFCAEKSGDLRIDGHSHSTNGFHTKCIYSVIQTGNAISYSFGENMSLYRTFPNEWLKYQGNPAPFGNPKLTTYMPVFNSFKDSMIRSISVRSNTHIINIKSSKSGEDVNTIVGKVNSVYTVPNRAVSKPAQFTYASTSASASIPISNFSDLLNLCDKNSKRTPVCKKLYNCGVYTNAEMKSVIANGLTGHDIRTKTNAAMRNGTIIYSEFQLLK